MRKSLQKKYGIYAMLLLFILCSFCNGCNNKNIKDKLATYSELSIDDITENIIHEVCKSEDEVLYNIDEIQKATFVRTIDGDTILCSIDDEEVYVRLIGIDTAESVNPNEEKNNAYGEQARDYTKNMLNSYEFLYLEYDSNLYDKYNRILAYIWLVDDDSLITEENISSYMLNYILLNDGYAYDMPVEPNLKYANTFFTVCENAKATRTGLWENDIYFKLYSK